MDCKFAYAALWQRKELDMLGDLPKLPKTRPGIAYLVAFIDTATGRIQSAGVFSEEHPTCSFKLFPVTVARIADQRGYHEAQEGLKELLHDKNIHFAWLLPFIDRPLHQ
jgi:hypothetical protein